MTRSPAPAAPMIALAAALAVTGCAALPSPHPLPPTSPPPRAACPRAPAPDATRAGAAQLLPFTAHQLHAAAVLAGRFTSYYGATGGPAAAYLARLRPLATRQLYAALARGVTASGSRGPAVIAAVSGEKVRDLAPGSVTFTVHATSGKGGPVVWAVTVVPAGRGWLVYDIEPATAGNGQ